MSDLQAIILGAGSTGLLIAQGLKKNGIKFAIYEREEEYKYTHHQRDWSMALLWGTNYLQNTLPESLLDRFDEIKADPHDNPGPDRQGCLPFYNGKTGELVVKIPGGVAVRVNREKLRKYLATDIDINFGKVSTKIVESGDKVTVTFEDGTSATADTVVCCDGIKGLGRTTLLAEKAALSTAPCSFVNICNKYTAEQARFIRETLDPMYKFAGHPDQPTLFMIVPVDIPDLDKPEEWRYQACLSTWGATHSESNEERLRVFKEAASNYAEPWRSAALWLPNDTYIPPDQIRYWAEPQIWPNWEGKITLAGDCAHPIVPFRAQGLNNALEDAYKYVQALVEVKNGKKSLADAVTEYGDETLQRGSAENKLSNMWGPVLHNWSAIMNTPMMKQGYAQKAREEVKAAEVEKQEEVKIEQETPKEEVKIEEDVAKEEVIIEEEAPKQEVHVEEEMPKAEIKSEEDTKKAEETPYEQPSAAPVENSTSDTPAEMASTPAPLDFPKSGLAPSVIAYGQYTPTDEGHATGLCRPLTPVSESGKSSADSDAEELIKLRKENERLHKRNLLLEEKLRAIQGLVIGVNEI